MLKEFRDFIARGNVVDMAVGIIIGAAFTSIVKSLVNDIISPVIGVLTGGIDFSYLFIALDGNHYASLEEARKVGAPVVAWGNFINEVITFLIVAFVVFLLVKAVNRMRDAMEKKEEPAPETPKGSTELEVLLEIRDALKNRS